MENFIFCAVFWILSKISDVMFLGKQLIAFSCLDMFLKMFVLKIFQKTFSMVIVTKFFFSRFAALLLKKDSAIWSFLGIFQFF